jgi:hypothetical protein
LLDQVALRLHQDTFCLEGLLLAGDDDGVRLAIGRQVLEFRAEDVLQVGKLRVPDGVEVHQSTAVRVTLKREARLLNAQPLEGNMGTLVVGKLPFSLAIRQVDEAQVLPSPSFREREQDFLRRRGLR